MNFVPQIQAAVPERIEHRAAKVSLVNGLTTVLTVVFQLVSVPVCLNYWGKERYGSWLALFSAFLLLRSIDGGFCAYVGNKLNYLYHGSALELRRHLASAAAGIGVTASLQLLLTVGALFIAPIAATLGMTGAQAQSRSAELGLLVLVVSWVTTGSYIGIIHRLLIPAGLMYQAAWWAMGLQVAQFAAMMAAAVMKLNMLQTSALFAFSQAMIYLLSVFYVRHKLPQFFPLFRAYRWRTGLSDLGKSSLLTASNLVQQTATSGAVLMVAAMAGTAAVPVFTTVRTLMNLWTSVTTVLSSPLLPDVVRIHAKGEIHKLVPINQTYWVLVGSAVNWGTLLIYPLLPWIYARWTTHAVALNGPLLSFMLASVVVTNAGALVSLHLNGINSLGIVLTASLARAALGLGIGLLGFSHMGLASFGLGAVAAELAVMLITGRYFAKHELARRGVHLPWTTLAPTLTGTGSAVLFFLGSGFGWWSGTWIWLLALVGVAIGSISGWRALDSSLRRRLRELPARLLRR